MIQVDQISRVYPNGKGIHDISFNVKENTIMGLLGPNGAGKTTTMSVITGFAAPDIGTVTINGFMMGQDTLKAKKSIGYLPENPPVYPDMYVEEYLDFAASLKGVAKAERRAQIESVMAKTGLTAVSKRLIKNLSKGYRQRVGIAQAILGNPQVIILDEPTVGLDPEQIIEVRDLIRSLKQDHTVILSSHILSEIAAVCDECLIIAGGRVVAMDSTENLMNRNQNRHGQMIKVLAKADEAQVREALSGLEDEIKEIEILSTEGSHISFKVYGEQGKDIRETLSQALFDHKILILESAVTKSSLEDIYLELMKDVEEEEAAVAEADEDVEEEEDTADTDGSLEDAEPDPATEDAQSSDAEGKEEE